MEATDYSQHTDQFLLQQLTHNDQAAFTAIYQRYWKSLFREAMNVLRSQKEAEDYYKERKAANPSDKSQIGFNCKTVKKDGKIVENVWKAGGMYAPAIDMIIYWLTQALPVAENEIQKQTLEKLINFGFDDFGKATEFSQN